MRILVSNDDGVMAPGLRSLVDALSPLGDVTVVAPERECSGYSSALTLQQPLRVLKLENGFYSVSGTPADCVHLALNGFLDFEPDLVVSGINAGANLGDDVIYSGTVAAAMEGRFLGKPALAVSLCGPHVREHGAQGFEVAAQWVARLLKHGPKLNLPARTVLNINVPDLPADQIRGVRMTRCGHRERAMDLRQMQDPRGRTVYWIGMAGEPADGGQGTDFQAIAENCVSVTPLTTDMTAYAASGAVVAWLEGMA
ncbi:MAG: 5'/3'-nucleotidase SurE [Pseudomonadales bacterium]|nr:5'/3'-nucleotidase SurE [Pseudomonadales bacterium]